jgi:hypothetical protein
MAHAGAMKAAAFCAAIAKKIAIGASLGHDVMSVVGDWQRMLQATSRLAI